MNELVTRIPLGTAEDVFALRQSGRAVAAEIGCDEADQVRFATALSELAREALAQKARASATFFLTSDDVVRVEIDNFPAATGGADPQLSGIAAARKLVDGLTVSQHGSSSTVAVTVSPRGRAGARVNSAQVRAVVQRSAAPRPLDELRLENRDLIATLTELRERQEQLAHLNAELEETNRGVMAMYGQLADELEETNRGVVALYAELDDKTLRLNEASEAKSRFLANVSHELRSPVNSILALTKLLDEPEGDAVTGDQRKQLAFILSSGNELLGLVNQLLDLAKAESGRLEPHIVAVELEPIFSELRGVLRPLLRPGVKLVVEPPPPEPIETDKTLLVHVLRNLLTNALKFTRTGSIRLFVRTEAPHEVELVVADTGIGIAPEDQAKIFEEFYQVRGPLQADVKGTGLGLPYARRVAQTLGGELTLESKVGAGSTFTLRLPRQWQSLVRAPQSPGAQPRPAVSVGTVLIVDDDDGFRTALRGMLQPIAASVLEAGDGREGLEIMRRTPPDLAFIDLRMPEIDGVTLLNEMRGDGRLNAIPAIIVTSMQLNTTLRATLGGAAAILSKSDLNRDTVAAAVATALAYEPT